MVSKTTGFDLENSHFTGFETATKFTDVTDLTVKNNSWSNVAWDAMIIGSVHNALFQNNDISLNVPGGRKHTDGMQFYNIGSKVSFERRYDPRQHDRDAQLLRATAST